MAKRIVLTPPVLRVLGVAAAVLVFALVVYSMAGMPGPRESDRIGPIDGSFSIITPRGHGFQSRVIYGPIDQTFTTLVEATQAGMIGGVDNKIAAARYRNPLDPEKAKQLGYLPTKFQGKDAYVLTIERRHEFAWQMILERHGQWYQLAVRLQRKEDIPNSEWWPFIESFQANEVSPSTQPATIPALTGLTTQPADLH